MKIIVQILSIIIITFFTTCFHKTYTYEGKTYKVNENIKKNKLNIKALNLSNNSKVNLKDLHKCTNLIYLNLSNKGLDSIPDNLCGLTSLKILVLNYNKLSYIPPCIFDMTNLEVISILGCEFEKIPAEFQGMSNLKVFIIVGNNFSEEEYTYLKQKLENTKVIGYFD
jgi:Leucine-rich repeat (LRR) protein